MKIADRIKELRKQRHYTQKELAELINVKPTTVSGWELGRNEPSIETIKKLSKILGVSFNYLAGVSDSSNDDLNITETDLTNPVLAFDGHPIVGDEAEKIRSYAKFLIHEQELNRKKENDK